MIPASDSMSHQEEAMSATNQDPGSQSSGVSMDLMSLMRLMARHWRVTVPAAVFTLVAVVGAFILKSPSYEAGASVVLFSPPLPSSSDDGAAPANPAAGENPFTRYGDLSVVADIVARKMNGEDIAAELKAEGVSGYTVVANKLQRGPVIDVTGTGPNPAAAIGSAKAAVAKFDSVLTDLQVAEGADPAYLITSAPVEPPDTAVAQVGSTVRTGIALLALGGLGTLGLAVAAEAFNRRRRESGDPASRPDVPSDPAPGTADDQTQAPGVTVRPAVWRMRDSGDDLADPPSRTAFSATDQTPDLGGDAPTDAANGARRSAPRIKVVPPAERPAGNQPGWTVWRPSSLAVAPDSNGHEKPATDRKS
jgi:hypothetical protein